MTVDDIVEFTEALGDVLTQQPGPHDAQVPAIAWGDTFFFYAPDGEIPARAQPFATIVTKPYPGEPDSDLSVPGAFRVNIAVGSDEFARRIGQTPRDAASSVGSAPAAADSITPHPTYASAGWLSVISPDASAGDVREMLTVAHHRAKDRFTRRA